MTDPTAGPETGPGTRPLILIGMKSSGKTTVGRLLAARLGVPFIDVDAELEGLYARRHGEKRPFREIFKQHGRDFFRRLEEETLHYLVKTLPSRCVLATGGGLPLGAGNRPLLRGLGTIIFLDVAEAELLPRITAGGIPPFFPYPDDPVRSLTELLSARRPVYQALADLTLIIGGETPEQIVDRIADAL